jgi:hypothetical protein
MMKKLLLSLFLIANLSNASEITTPNLVDQNFNNGGWSGTADGRHGSGTIASEHNTYIQSNPVAVNNHLTQDQINFGFSVNASEEIWHWNNYDSTVQRTIRATIPNSTEIISQTRTINSPGCGSINCGGYVSYSDTMIIGANSVDNYNLDLRYDFTDTSLRTNNHYGVDLKEPVLSVTYTENPVILETSIVENLSTFDNFLLEDIRTLDLKEDFKVEEKFKMEEPKFTYEEPTFKAPEKFETYESPQLKEEASTEVFQEVGSFIKEEERESPQEQAPRFVEEGPREPETVEKEPSSLRAEQKSNEEASTKTETQTEKEQTTEAGTDNKSNVSSGKKSFSLAKSMEKIDAQVKDIGKNLKLKNLVKIKLMSDNDVLLDYANIPFYQPKNIYLDQINIRDNRILYNNVTLVSYQQKDPIFQAQKELFEIRQEKQKLIRELQILKNVR